MMEVHDLSPAQSRVVQLEKILREANQAIEASLGIVTGQCLPNWDWLRDLRKRIALALESAQ